MFTQSLDGQHLLHLHSFKKNFLITEMHSVGLNTTSLLLWKEAAKSA